MGNSDKNLDDEVTVSDWQSFKNISSTICRICSSISDLLLPIFEGEGLEHQLQTKINKYLPITVDINDQLPLTVCYQCTSSLITWHELSEICLSAENKFKTLIKKEDTVSEHSGAEDDGRLVVDSEDEALSVHIKRKRQESLTNSPTVTPKRKKSVLKNPKASTSDDNDEPPVFDVSLVKTEIVDDTYNEPSTSNDNQIIPEKKVKCEYCHKVYKAAKHLHRHVKKVHKDQETPLELQKCNLCNNIYKTKTNLKKHYENEHMKNQVECPVCRSSVNSRKLELHLKTVHGVQVDKEEGCKYACKFCAELFKSKYVRNLHVREIHLNEPVKCVLCDFEGIRTVVKRHKREVHCNKKFPCSVCGVSFKTMHTLKMHMTTHSDLRCYTCELCGMGFKRLNNVRDHMKCHEEKSNQCQICGNFFARKRYLAIHEKTIHNFYADGVEPEEKGFECSTCGAKLKWKKNLLAHMRIHTGEKPYSCKICKKSFICHGSLRSHMAKHGVCATLDKNLESLVSPLHYDIQDLQPQIEMQCM